MSCLGGRRAHNPGLSSNRTLCLHSTSLTAWSCHNEMISSLHAASTCVGSSLFRFSLLDCADLPCREPILARDSGEVARSSVAFQPLFARTHISREGRSGSKFSGSSLRASAVSMESRGERRSRICRWLAVRPCVGIRKAEEGRERDVGVEGFRVGVASISSCTTSSSFLIELRMR